MDVIVTGSSGFLGSRLCPFLEERGCRVERLTSQNCDLLDYHNLEALPKRRFDLIFHLAAWTQAGDFCLRHPGEQWINNQLLNTNVLRWWKEAQPEAKLILVGTSCAYSPKSDYKEEQYMLGEPSEDLYSYAMTKRMLYLGARMLQKQFGMDYLCVVPSTLYGPGYHADGRQMHFIFDLARKIIRGKEFGEKVVLWGDGNQVRELIWVDDFINAAWELNKNHKNDIFNIGEGKGHSIRLFADTICKLVDYPSSFIVYDTNQYVGTSYKVLDSSKAKAALKAALGEAASFKPLEIGLEEVIRWFHQTKAHEANSSG